MCGILGIVTDTPQRPDALQDRVRRMGRWQAHRGPDAWGEWIRDGVALGHNRLSIIDIACGAQPMSAPRHGIHVVFNGEIYNAPALRTQLVARGHHFRTDHSDTEVIVVGYLEWNTDVFTHLEGMFAIGLWDERQRRLLLARDRAGIKPMYFAHDGPTLAFASEPKSLLASGVVQPRLNAAALPEYFHFRAPMHPETLFEGIRKLAPGELLEFEPARRAITASRYWTPGVRPIDARTPEDAEAEVLSVLDDAVRSHLLSDVPVGVFLSGGVDSSLVAALVARHAPLDAFTIGTESPLDERPFAERVAAHVGLRLHTLTISAADFLRRLDDWAYHNDDPVSDPSALALMMLAEHARSHGMKVMLAGEGADELFGGYNAYHRYAFYHRLSQLPASPRVGRWLAGRVGGRDGDYLAQLRAPRFLGTAHAISASEARSLMPELAGHFEARIRERLDAAPRTDDPLRAAMLIDQQLRLPDDVLARTDRATMALSLETRVPFLDRRVIDVANGLPSSWCVRLPPHGGKWLLKRIAARLVPREVVYRRKRGFDLPLHSWLARDLDARLADYLGERRLPYVDYAVLARSRDALRRGSADPARLLWQWMVLEEWYRRWILGEASPRTAPLLGPADGYGQVFDTDAQLAG